MKNLKSFKIKNFKNLKEISLEKIGQVNLIVGDNNVGKTSLLESLLFSREVIIYIILHEGRH